MSSATNTNGRVRRTLADQIDRLDAVLDGLADNLNEAVAMAVKEAVGAAVKEAVQAVLTEVLANPAILAKLGGAVPPVAQPASETPKPGLRQRLGRVWGWVRQKARAVCQVARDLLGPGRQACVKLVRRARQGCASFWGRVQVLRHFKVQLLTALCVGVAAGSVAYFAGPWFAAGVSAAGGFATTLAVHAGLWFRRLLSATTPATS